MIILFFNIIMFLSISWDNLHWPIVDRAVEATLNVTGSVKPSDRQESHLLSPWMSKGLYKTSAEATSATVIRARRSALDFVGGSKLKK